MKNLKKVKNIKLVFLLLFLNYNLYSQNTSNIIKVTGIAGTAYINERITPKEAKEEALKDAQRNALKKAGVSEFLQSSVMLITDSKNEKNSDFLSSEFQSHLEGAILDFQVISSNTIQTKENLLLVSVLIDATIIKYDTRKLCCIDFICFKDIKIFTRAISSFKCSNCIFTQLRI